LAYVWRYTGTCLKPADLPAGVLDEWETTLKNMSAQIKASLDSKIITPDKFTEYLATPSYQRYADFLATVGAGWDVNMIELKQQVKILASKQAWLDGIADAFVDGYFGARVTSKKDKYKLARFVMGAVGHRPTVGGSYGVWNPVSVGMLLLRGDKRPFTYFDANDTIAPNQAAHEVALDAQLGALITPSIIAKSVQGVMFCKYANEGGKNEAWIDTNIITPFNAKIATLIDACKLSGYTVSYVLDWIQAQTSVNVVAELTAKA